MRKILFFGDSITDAGRNRTTTDALQFGAGFVMQIVGRLYEKSPVNYTVVNKGISGNRIVDLYARIKCDVWNEKPDVLSILIGINDIWHELERENGVDIERFEKVYRMLIEDTKKALPNTKIIICEPFCLRGSATEAKFDEFMQVVDYAKISKKIATDYNLEFLPLQKVLDDAAKKYTPQTYLDDGVHPSIHGSILIANEWMALFEKMEKEDK